MSHHYNQNNPHLVILGKYEIPHDHIERHFTHSHGHGGQNVNKVATKVQLKVYLGHLNLPQDYIWQLNRKFPQGHVEVSAQDTRHQHVNLEIAYKRMQETIEEALGVAHSGHSNRNNQHH